MREFRGRPEYATVNPVESWTFEHSVDCSVPKEFAWSFWTDVRNWALDADVESIDLDGPFVAGMRGVTQSKRIGKVEWRIADVQPGEATIEFPAPGATARFHWSFAGTENGVRITQRVSFQGEKAAHYAETFGPELAAGIPSGMRKLCEAVEAAQP